MPDISQIVPLAKVLSVTTDTLLGMNTSESDDVNEVFGEIRKMWDDGFDNQSNDRRGCDLNRKSYEMLRELVRKYPMNYSTMLECAWLGYWYYKHAVRERYFELTEHEEKAIYTDVERMINCILNYDRTLERQLSARSCLISLCCAAGEFDRANAEVELLPSHVSSKLEEEYIIASSRDDRPERLRLMKKIFSEEAYKFCQKTYLLGSAYSIFGKPVRDKAIEVWKYMIVLCDTLFEAVPSIIMQHWKKEAWIALAKEYLRDSRVEDVIDCAEAIVELDLLEYEQLKPGKECKVGESIFCGEYDITDENDAEKLKEGFKWDLILLYEECSDRENNPVVSSPRFKALVDKINSL